MTTPPKPEQWKCGDEFLPFHHKASHVNPDYRDGWNACFKAAALQAPVVPQWLPIKSAPNDATPILTFNRNGRLSIETGHYMHHMINAAKIDGDDCFYTHWMPLRPPSPTLQEPAK